MAICVTLNNRCLAPFACAAGAGPFRRLPAATDGEAMHCQPDVERHGAMRHRCILAGGLEMTRGPAHCQSKVRNRIPIDS